MIIAQTIFGIVVLISVTWLLSENRRGVRVRGILAGLAVQFIFAFLMLRLPLFKELFHLLNGMVMSLEEATKAGTSFVFGYLGGGALPFEVKPEVSSFLFAFQALPLVLVVSALSSLLFYWRISPSSSGPFPGRSKRPWAWAAPSASGRRPMSFSG